MFPEESINEPQDHKEAEHANKDDESLHERRYGHFLAFGIRVHQTSELRRVVPKSDRSHSARFTVSGLLSVLS